MYSNDSMEVRLDWSLEMLSLFARVLLALSFDVLVQFAGLFQFFEFLHQLSSF